MFTISNVKLRGRRGTFKVWIEGDKVRRIEESSENGDLDGEGKLLTESFVVPHLHLDKVETGPEVPEGVSLYRTEGDSRSAIERAAKVKVDYDEESVALRASRTLLQCVKWGVTDVRAFADVDPVAELRGLLGLIRARDSLRGILNVQVVAFPQQGILREEGTEDLLYEALKRGADVVGGIPWIERSQREMEEHVRIVLDLAEKSGKPVALLVDDAPDPKLNTLEILAREVLTRGWKGGVEACHARALSLYDPDRRRKVLELTKEAGISLVANPHTGNLNLPVREALSLGINVSLGQDDCNDAYYPFGRCNMAEVAFLAAHLLDMMNDRDMENLFDMITWRAARTIGLERTLRPGSQASLVLLKRENVREALRHHDGASLVFNEGRITYDST
ncbi:cytosine deaminase [Sulfodiicoccus acidiphilus]|uniref:Cytosine deaminase n=1 Tax=Sulfodiicoccus acidiphilus TaxID=1670455 RepID=A0A348B5W1_9CREN|nr:amidohydrolase family protein [Sulfodiicoccus acidiphilus]BBD73563.1 cytosine deaminase [Sulfodiicoccus acidiphilus]GGT92292.1 cytosine deaminase [Sulfodiicoccus acidiphilus]